MGKRNYEEECGQLENKLASIQELAAALDIVISDIESSQDNGYRITLHEIRALHGCTNAIADLARA